MASFTSTMNCEEFIKQKEARIMEIYNKNVLEHPESGKIACYIISNGELNPEQQQTNENIFAVSVSEVAAELSVKLHSSVDENN